MACPFLKQSHPLFTSKSSAVSGALAKERISLESMLQRGRSQSGEVPVVLTTHETEEAAMRRALARIGKLGAVAEEPCLIRIEAF